MKAKTKMPGVSEQIRLGLEDALAHMRGELTLVTITPPLPPNKTTPKKIAALRRKLHMSQSFFAATLNVSKKTVQSWEQGIRSPSDASLRLLQIIGNRPDVVDSIISDR